MVKPGQSLHHTLVEISQTYSAQSPEETTRLFIGQERSLTRLDLMRRGNALIKLMDAFFAAWSAKADRPVLPRDSLFPPSTITFQWMQANKSLTIKPTDLIIKSRMCEKCLALTTNVLPAGLLESRESRHPPLGSPPGRSQTVNPSNPWWTQHLSNFLGRILPIRRTWWGGWWW